MTTWYKVKWIDPLFAAFNAAFPHRAKGSDGTIGDLAHQQGVSGHNPDDTPGVRAERSDADTKPEVRAADVTTALNGERTMQDVIDSILRTPADRDRLIYIIFNGHIWRKSNGWRKETYTGADQHREHAHFSGDPASDEDGAPWTSIIEGDDMAGEIADRALQSLDGNNALGDVYLRLLTGRDNHGEPSGDGASDANLTEIVARLAALEAAVAKLAPGPVTVTLTDGQLEGAVARVIARTKLDVAPTA